MVLCPGAARSTTDLRYDGTLIYLSARQRANLNFIFIYLKGGNPKGGFCDDVVTYWNFDEYIEIYIDLTIR